LSTLGLIAGDGIEFDPADQSINVMLSASNSYLSLSSGLHVDLTTLGPAITSLPNLATVGTITSGTWHGTVIDGQYGGTGVANTGKSITIGGDFTTAGAFSTTLTVTGTTNSTLPAGTHTLAAIDVAQSWSAVQTFLDTDFALRNPANTASVTLGAGAQTANRTFTFPVVTANRTIAVTGQNQTFTAAQTFSGTLTVSGTLNVTGGSSFTNQVDFSIITCTAPTSTDTPLTVTAAPSQVSPIILVQDDSTNAILTFKADGSLFFNKVGAGLEFTEGTDASLGVATLVGGTVTVNNTKVAANSRIFVTVQSLGGVAAPVGVAVTARTAGTSFTITSASALDTSVVAWMIVTPH
jgi:hypothetical protein